jgi:pyruvate, water dikinase
MHCIHLTPGIEISQVGQKAANLGKSIALGMQVPQGFVVVRSALGLFLEEAGFLERVHHIIQEDKSHDRIARKQLSDELCSEILSAPYPPALEEEICSQVEHFLKMAPVGLAVRSSGIHEDTGTASFAGVYESFLCLSSARAVCDAIRKCWCSSFVPSAIDYAQRMDVSLSPDNMAVIVQVMVSADRSGVLFTADPLTGNPWRFVLNSTFGLAQDLVGGGASADRFDLEWDTGKILERRIVEKPISSVANSSGVCRFDTHPGRKKKPSLTEEKIYRLARLGLDLDRSFGCRVDIEWALDGNTLYIVQVRPMTALPGFFPHELSEPESRITWNLSNSDPTEPFTRDIKGSEQWARYREPTLGMVEWPELDFNGYMYQAEYSYTSPSLNSDELEEWLGMNESRLKKAWLKAKHRMQDSWFWALEAKNTGPSAADIIPALLQMREWQADLQAMILGPPQFMWGPCENLLESFVREVAPEFDVSVLLQGIPTFSYERTKAAQELGRSINEDRVKTAFSEQQLDAIIPWLLTHYPECHFLREYERFCHRFASVPPSWLLRPARWAQAMVLDRSQELLIIRSAMLGEGRDIIEVTTKSIRTREKAEEDFRRLASQRDPSLLVRLESILDWTQFWAPVLDDRRWSHLPYYALLDLLWEAGIRLKNEGLIDDPEDVKLLLPEDLERIANCTNVLSAQPLYGRRKGEYEHNQRLSPPDSLGKPPQSSPEVDDSKEKKNSDGSETPLQLQSLQGQGVTPGRAAGISRKVRDLKDPRLLNSLSDEHILVCQEGSFDNQTDWLGILMIVKGLITMDGYPCHHATQISRECGVVFINLPDAERVQIPDNTRITLDGSTGVIGILDEF